MNDHLHPDERRRSADQDPDVLDDALDQADDALSLRLRELLDPSAGLRNRTTHVVDRNLRGRSALATGLDLLGLGLWTARSLLSDPPPPADREDEGI